MGSVGAPCVDLCRHVERAPDVAGLCVWQRLSSKALILFLVDCHPNMHLEYKFEENDETTVRRTSAYSTCVVMAQAPCAPFGRTKSSSMVVSRS